MAKGQVMSEELKGQLGERLPTASIAMAQAAQDIGLIGKDIKKANLEEHLFKLMENGKVLAKDILPAFSKRLKESANAGNAVAVALKENFAVALGIAVNNVESLSNSLFTGGLGGSLKLVLDSFNEISPKIQDLAYLFGKVLGGAIMGVTFPVTMLVAGLTDLWTITKMVTGVNDEMGESFLSLGAQILGVLAGVKLLIWGLKKVAALAGVIKGAKALVSGDSDGNKGGGKGKSTKPTSKLGKVGSGLSKVGGLALNPYVIAGTVGVSAALEHGGKGGSMSAGGLFGDNPFTSFLDTPISELIADINKVPAPAYNKYNYPTQPQRVDINVKSTVDSEGNMKAFVDSRIESADSDNQERAMNSIGSLY